MKLTGRAVTDYANASLIGIAFDMETRSWDTAMLEEIGLDPDKLSVFYEVFHRIDDKLDGI